VARYVFHVVLAAVAGMTTAVPFLHRERSVTLDARTGLRKGEHRKGRADHMVLVDVQRDGADGAIQPGELPSLFPEHEPGEQAPRVVLSRDRQGGIEWNACGPAAIRHREPPGASAPRARSGLRRPARPAPGSPGRWTLVRRTGRMSCPRSCSRESRSPIALVAQLRKRPPAAPTLARGWGERKGKGS
jgi:hypothetical protein